MKWKVLLLKAKRPWEITFICSGNIMRSPYAEILARNLVREKITEPEKRIIFRSGAIFHQNTELHPLVAKKLLHEGIPQTEILNHVPRHVKNYPAWFKSTTIFLTMTKEHLKALARIFPDNSFLFSEVIGFDHKEIEDPYYNKLQEEEIFIELKSWVKIVVNLLIDTEKEVTENQKLFID